MACYCCAIYEYKHLSKLGVAEGQVEISADDVLSGLADMATLTGGAPQPNGVGNVVATQPHVGPNIVPSYQVL